MPRGGSRPGAGRKPKVRAEAKPSTPQVDAQGFKTPGASEEWPFGMERPSEGAEVSPLAYLLGVMRDGTEDKSRRMQAAIQAAPYLHLKKGEAGKKEQKQTDAKHLAGRFSSSAAPKLVAAGGKKV